MGELARGEGPRGLARCRCCRQLVRGRLVACGGCRAGWVAADSHDRDSDESAGDARRATKRGVLGLGPDVEVRRAAAVEPGDAEGLIARQRRATDIVGFWCLTRTARGAALVDGAIDPNEGHPVLGRCGQEGALLRQRVGCPCDLSSVGRRGELVQAIGRELGREVVLISLVPRLCPARRRTDLVSGRRRCRIGATTLEQHHGVLLLLGADRVLVGDDTAGRMGARPRHLDLLAPAQILGLTHAQRDMLRLDNLLRTVDQVLTGDIACDRHRRAGVRRGDR